MTSLFWAVALGYNRRRHFLGFAMTIRHVFGERLRSLALISGLFAVSAAVQAQMGAPIGLTGAGGDSPDAAVFAVPPRIANVPGSNLEGELGRSVSGGQVRSTGEDFRDGRKAKPALTEFQKFALEATGKVLPIYGADFFQARSGSAYVPSPAAPVSGDYSVGAGDELVIRGSGTVEIDYRAIVDRNGLINIPRVGAIAVAGVKAAQIEEVVKAAVGRVFKGFSLSVTLGRLRGITVYVVGQARKPGTYSVSGVSTVISAMFESGGPAANGSVRRVAVRRSGKQVAELDLYAFLSRGDKSGDIRLVDGDVIVIPPAAGYIAVSGKLDAPAIYELRGADDSVQSILDVAGGLSVLADPRRAFLERVSQDRQLPRSVEEFALDTQGLRKTLKNGDLLSVLPISAEFANAVVLQGSVRQALRVPFHDGMKVSDLIPGKDFLVSKASQKRRNQALVMQDEREAEVQRRVFAKEQALLDSNSQEPKPRYDVIPLTEQIGSLYDDINWDYAVIERPERNELTQSLISFNLGKALSDPSSSDNVALRPGDSVTVFSADDVRIPQAKRRVYVRVEGEVRRPGIYKAEPGESLLNLLERAGGVTRDAYLFGSEFYRESVRRSQQENLDKLVNRLEQQSLSASGRLVANASSNDPQAGQLLQARLAAETESRNRFMQRLRELKSSGRIALGLPTQQPILANMPELRLEHGDKLVIPSRPDFVQVFGAVSAEAALLYQPGRAVSDYVARAGLTRDADAEAMFVLRADGTVLSNSDRWLSSVAGLEVLPGDIIVAPEKLDKESFWTAFARGAKDWTQIFSNLGLGAAAIRTLR